MAAQLKLFQQLTWLLDTVYSFGPLSKEDIDRKWVSSPYNYDHESQYNKRNLHRHRDYIGELFGIQIECNRSTNMYYIGKISKSSSTGVRGWIINTFALNNMVNLTADMKDRVIYEDIPEGTRYLTTIMHAMKEEKQLYATYQGFKREKPHSFLLAPYCLKVFKQRWYLVGKPEDHPEEPEPRVYALDRMKELTIVDKQFKIPRKFDAAVFFQNQFGVDRSKTKAEHVRIKVEAWDANFLRSLPLHHSQKELEQNDNYSIFEYSIAPTTDFILELRKYGPKLEVLAPVDLRNQFAEEAQTLAKMYS